MYGLLGVLPQGVQEEFPADYNLTVADVYERVVEPVIRTTGRLDVLCDAIHFPLHTSATSTSLPTFVPDWSYIPQTASLGQLCLMAFVHWRALLLDARPADEDALCRTLALGQIPARPVANARGVAVVPLGCATPVLLRQEGRRGRFRFVGDVDVDGYVYVYGKAADQWKAEKRQAERYELH